MDGWVGEWVKLELEWKRRWVNEEKMGGRRN